MTLQIHPKHILSQILKLKHYLLEKPSVEQPKKRFTHRKRFSFAIHFQNFNLLCNFCCCLKKKRSNHCCALQYDNQINILQGQSLPKNLIRHSRTICYITFIQTDTNSHQKILGETFARATSPSQPAQRMSPKKSAAVVTASYFDKHHHKLKVKSPLRLCLVQSLQVMRTWELLPRRQGGQLNKKNECQRSLGFHMVLDSTDLLLNDIKERTKPLLPLPSQGPRLKRTSGGEPVSFKRN